MPYIIYISFIKVIRGFMKITRENAGSILSDFFIDKGITQKKLAEKSKITESTVSGILQGKKPDSLTVNKINRYLKTFPE